MGEKVESPPLGVGERRVTLAMVAVAANCSLATASKALSRRSDISGETRERVLAVAATLGYLPRVRKSDTVRRVPSLTVAFDGYGSLYTNELQTGALLAATKAGMELDCAILPAGIGETTTANRWVAAKKQAGHLGAVLVTSVVSEALAEASVTEQFPLVSIDPKSSVNPAVVSIGSTNWVGAVSVTEYLLGLGHRRIAFAGLHKELAFSVERFAGFRSSMEQAGVAVESALVFAGLNDYQNGFDIAQKIVRMASPPTAIFCVCDMVAFGIIEGGRQRGLLVPRDLSVAGFDDVAPARWSSPALTTVRQPLRRMGGLAVRTLLRLAQGHEPESHLVQLSTNLIVRDSTAPYETPGI